MYFLSTAAEKATDLGGGGNKLPYHADCNIIFNIYRRKLVLQYIDFRII